MEISQEQGDPSAQTSASSLLDTNAAPQIETPGGGSNTPTSSETLDTSSHYPRQDCKEPDRFI